MHPISKKKKTSDKAEKVEKIEKKASKKKAATKNAAKAMKAAEPKKVSTTPFSDALVATDGFELDSVDTRATPAFSGSKKEAEELMEANFAELADLQERLFASERHPDGRSLLLVLQGMDTSGKGGIMRHVVRDFDPQGLQLHAFKAPSAEEKRHPFLWRIRKALPKPGYVGVFDRSHYEDVLIVRVHEMVDRAVWMRRYSHINDFEATQVKKGTTIIKIMLHISSDEQKARLLERLDDPTKVYKFNPQDVIERGFWGAYQEAYQAAIQRTSTADAPWFVVPADRKWYARLAVQQILIEHLRAMDLQWPTADFDVAEERKLIEAS